MIKVQGVYGAVEGYPNIVSLYNFINKWYSYPSSSIV